MATRIEKRWQPTLHGASRRERAGCTYHAYLPDPLVGWDPPIPADVVADLSDAEAGIRDLNEAGVALASLEGVARFLLRTEAVASSHIEGLSLGARRIARAEASLALDGRPDDALAAEILGNVHSMSRAIELGASEGCFRLDDLLDLHRRLLGASHPGLAGVVRASQNWIGGSGTNPCRAEFVPAPPEHLAALLDDLVRYLTGDAHSPLVQAAVVHAQFETLHPFADGNGRTGRALVHVVLRRRALAKRFVPPISLALAARSRAYVGGLTAFRHLGAADGPERSTGLAEWLRFFAGATIRAIREARRLAAEIEALQQRWRERVGRVRRGSAVDVLLRELAGTPVLTAESAAARLGRSKARATDAVNALTSAGILEQRNLGKQRYRVFEAPDVLDLLADLDAALALPVDAER